MAARLAVVAVCQIFGVGDDEEVASCGAAVFRGETASKRKEKGPGKPGPVARSVRTMLQPMRFPLFCIAEDSGSGCAKCRQWLDGLNSCSCGGSPTRSGRRHDPVGVIDGGDGYPASHWSSSLAQSARRRDYSPPSMLPQQRVERLDRERLQRRIGSLTQPR
jgi:hypothetical protein